jgi:hypothetical protein
LKTVGAYGPKRLRRVNPIRASYRDVIVDRAATPLAQFPPATQTGEAECEGERCRGLPVIGCGRGSDSPLPMKGGRKTGEGKD